MPLEKTAHCNDKLSFASDVATEHFGKVPGLVVDRLLKLGPATLEQLISHCSNTLPSGGGGGRIETRVHRALLVLIHHNCVNFVLGAPPKYYCTPDAVLMRIRHPKLVALSKSMFGDDGAAISKLLLKHGRLRASTLMEFMLDSPVSPYSHLADDSRRKKEATVREILERMLQHHFVEVCPSVSFAAQTESLKGAAAFEAELARSKKPRGKKPPVKRKRDEESTGKSKKAKGVAVIGQDEDDGEGAVGGLDMAPEPMFEKMLRINTVQYLQATRCRECSGMVKKLVNEQTGSLVDILTSQPQRITMELPRNIENDLSCIPTLPRMSHPTRMEKLELSFPDTRRLPEVLKALEMPSPHMANGVPLVRKVGGGYSVNLEALSDAYISAQMEHIMGKKFGNLGRRVFRILAAKKILEEKEIASYSIAAEAEIRSILYRMHATGYLQVREVATTNDRNPHKTFYLWSVPTDMVRVRFVEEMYKTLRNLYNRLRHERETIVPLLQAGDRDGLSSLTEDQAAQIHQWNKSQEAISLSVVALYELVIALEFF